MPKIIQDEKQTKALRDIGESLDLLRKIVEVQDLSENGTLTVSAGNGRRKGVSVDVDANTATKIAKVLSGQAKEVAKEITKLSKSFRIMLDDDEEALVSRALSEARTNMKQVSIESAESAIENSDVPVIDPVFDDDVEQSDLFEQE